MIIYERIVNGVCTNRWTNDNGFDATYTEPGWGDPSTYTITQTDMGDVKAKAEAQVYLNSTDWYVIRLMDNGTPIPDDIKAQRQAARLIINPVKA